MGEVLPIGAEMTQRYLQHQRPIQAYVKAHKSWKPGARCTTQAAQQAEERLHGGLVGLSLFNTAQLI